MDVSVESDEAPAIPRITCEKHTDKHVEYYCSTHNVVVCDSCKETTHRKCSYADLDKEVADMKKRGSFESIIKQIDNLKVEYSKLRKQREANNSEMNSLIDTCRNEIKEARKEINKVLDALEFEMMDKVNKVKEELTNDIDNHCKTIDETLRQIDSRRNVLELCQKSFDSQAKFFGVTYIRSAIQDLEQIKADIEMEIHEIKIKFKPDPALDRLLKQVKTFGEVVVGKTSQKAQPAPSLVGVSLAKPSTCSTGSKTVHGSSFMPSGQLLLACGTDGVKLLDEQLAPMTSISNIAFDVAAVNVNEAIVAQGTKQQLQFLAMEPTLNAGRILKIDRKCWQVDVDGEDLFVVCHDNPGNGEVRILNMQGTLQRRLEMSHGNLMLTHPSCVKVSKHTGTVFIADSATNVVLCLDRQGNINFLFCDMELMRPTGIYIDDYDNLLVCGKESDNMLVLSSEGKKEKTIALPKGKIEGPTCLAFRNSDGCLAIGLSDNDKSLATFLSQWPNNRGTLTSYVYGWFGWK